MGLFRSQGKNNADINNIADILKLDSKAVLIDVRESSEYASGHIPQSRNYPLGRVVEMSNAIDDKSVPVYVYCHSGVRSAAAAKKLKKAGFVNVKNLGGIMRYRGPLEK